MQDAAQIRRDIRNREKQIVALHQNIRHTFARRNAGPQAQAAWHHACAEFHAHYPHLLYPQGQGGETQWLEDLSDGDEFAIEYALQFIALRPYFFRSGYMRQKLLRRLNHVPLNDVQRRRHQELKQQFHLYRLQKSEQS